MLGRSDGVLNPGGIRFGPTDIYSVLENDEYSKLGVEETLVVGLMVEGGADEKVILFVKVRPFLMGFLGCRLTPRCVGRRNFPMT
jgi:acetoacetyl-CoA synthetase